MAFTTRKSLLMKVRQGDEISWNEFYNAYRPLIRLVGQDCGLTTEENEDLIQQVMSEIFQKNILEKYDIDHVPNDVTFTYDPSKGRFRYFLKAIIRNQARKIYHKRTNFVNIDDITEPLDNGKFDEDWDREWQKVLLAQAMEELKNQVQPVTFSAFQMYALDERPVKEVAKFLDLSVNSVYVAKNRCIAALKDIINELEKK